MPSTNPDWDEIDRLMKDGETWYGVVALSQLVDSYKRTGDDKNKSIVEPGFEEFVNHCFWKKVRIRF